MSTTDDLRSALAADDGSLPERWNPDDEPGTTLIGTLLGFETIATKMGEGKLAIIEDEDDGTTYGVLIGRTVLRKAFDRLDPHPGDMIGLKYVGWVEPKNKDAMGYHNYAVKVQRGSAPPPPTQSMVSEATGHWDDDKGDDDSLPF